VVFPCFFFTLLLMSSGNEYNYDGVRSWAQSYTPNGIFHLKKLLIPINVARSHWAILEVHFRNKTFAYYDSLGYDGSVWIRVCKQYLVDEFTRGNFAEMNSPSVPNLDSWDIIDTSHCNVQQNGCDCGVFTIAFMVDLWNDRRVLVQQEEMPSWRLQIWQTLQPYRNTIS